MTPQSNIIPHQHKLNVIDKQSQNGHQSFVLWFTGLSGSGKSTIADAVEQELYKQQIHTYILDGDNIRMGLNKGLGFSEEDRNENLRRISEVAKLFVDAGIVVLSAFVSPLRSDREMIKNIIGKENFIEIFINTSLEECEKRDVKGLYKKARAGEIKDFTGITSPYEAPLHPQIEIKTEEMSVENAVNFIIQQIKEKIKTN